MNKFDVVIRALMTSAIIIVAGCSKFENRDFDDGKFLTSLSCVVSNNETKLSSTANTNKTIDFSWEEGDAIYLFSCQTYERYLYAYNSTDNNFYPVGSPAPISNEGYYAVYKKYGRVQVGFDFDGYGKNTLKFLIMEYFLVSLINGIDENGVPDGIDMISDLSYNNHFVFEHLKGLLKINLKSEYAGYVYRIEFQKKGLPFNNGIYVYPHNKEMVEADDQSQSLRDGFGIKCNNTLLSDYTSFYLDIRPGIYDGFTLTISLKKDGYEYVMTKDIAAGGVPLIIERGKITDTPNMSFVPDNNNAAKPSFLTGYPNCKIPLPSIASYDESPVTTVVWSSENTASAIINDDGTVSCLGDYGANNAINLRALCNNANSVNVPVYSHPGIWAWDFHPIAYANGESLSISLSEGIDSYRMDATPLFFTKESSTGGPSTGGHTYHNGETIEWTSTNTNVATISVNDDYIRGNIASGSCADLTPISTGFTVIKYIVKKDGVTLYEHSLNLEITE